jgi:exonuclease SbcC
MMLKVITPGITSTATEMLRIIQPEWETVIEMERPDSKGKKEINDFSIYVNRPAQLNGAIGDLSLEIDAPEFVKTAIDKLSGGEQVLIEASLMSAVAQYLMNRSGRRFETIFRDEADGNLSPEKAQKYYELLEAAHGFMGLDKTFLITHRPEIIANIPQKIILDTVVGEVRVEAA